MKRVFGKLGFEVTTLGLGGQASLQWTPEGVDPVKIILKAFNLGINYFDTSNLYGPSQENYGKAFKIKKLIPGKSGSNENLRQSISLLKPTCVMQRVAAKFRVLPTGQTVNRVLTQLMTLTALFHLCLVMEKEITPKVHTLI
jgi:hypothetical protein